MRARVCRACIPRVCPARAKPRLTADGFSRATAAGRPARRGGGCDSPTRALRLALASPLAQCCGRSQSHLRSAGRAAQLRRRAEVCEACAGADQRARGGARRIRLRRGRVAHGQAAHSCAAMRQTRDNTQCSGQHAAARNIGARLLRSRRSIPCPRRRRRPLQSTPRAGRSKFCWQGEGLPPAALRPRPRSSRQPPRLRFASQLSRTHERTRACALANARTRTRTRACRSRARTSMRARAHPEPHAQACARARAHTHAQVRRARGEDGADIRRRDRAAQARRNGRRAHARVAEGAAWNMHCVGRISFIGIYPHLFVH
jgi:hypothetical protein